MTIADPVELLITLLKDDSGVKAIADDRVGREVPEGDGPLMPRGCVVLQPAGGSGRPGLLKIRKNRIDTHCYGSTLSEAWLLHLAVREALETFTHDGDLIEITTLSDGANGRRPDNQWPVCFASYRVTSAA